MFHNCYREAQVYLQTSIKNIIYLTERIQISAINYHYVQFLTASAQCRENKFQWDCVVELKQWRKNYF